MSSCPCSQVSVLKSKALGNLILSSRDQGVFCQEMKIGHSLISSLLLTL